MIALARNHVPLLQQLGVDADRIRMLRSFDPRSGAFVLDVDDPYYGDHDDFETTFAAIEASLARTAHVGRRATRAGRTRLMRRLAFLLRPGWIALAVVVIAFTYLCFSVLAPWQLGKNTKTSRENDQIQQSLTTAPVPLKTLLPQQDSSAPDAQWRRVTATGHYLPDKQVVARLRVADGEPGDGGAAAVRRRRRPDRPGRPRLRAATTGFAGTADRPTAPRDGDRHGAPARLRGAGAGQGVVRQ